MDKDDHDITFLGEHTKWEGTLKFKGTIRIDGHFKGDIQSDGNLIIGEEGMIEADINAGYIVNSGEIHGNIISNQRVDIQTPGKVFGDIEAPTVVIDKGVIFEGSTRMYKAKRDTDGQSDVIVSDDYAGGPPPDISAVYGFVMNEITGKPVKNAKVRCRAQGEEKKDTYTNASGYYELIILQDGKWSLKIEAKGYRRKTIQVIISEGEPCEQRIDLRPKKRKNPKYLIRKYFRKPGYHGSPY